MRRLAWLMIGLLGLAACATTASGPDAARPASYDGSAGSGASAGQWAASVLGTPFYLVFKGAVCGATLVVAGPAAAFFALSEANRQPALAALGDGIASNCGPPYVLTPSRIG